MSKLESKWEGLGAFEKLSATEKKNFNAMTERQQEIVINVKEAIGRGLSVSGACSEVKTHVPSFYVVKKMVETGQRGYGKKAQKKFKEVVKKPGRKLKKEVKKFSRPTTDKRAP